MYNGPVSSDHLFDVFLCVISGVRISMVAVKVILYRTSLSISENAESPPIARCSEYFDEILVSFSSCMLMELLEQSIKKLLLTFKQLMQSCHSALSMFCLFVMGFNVTFNTL